MLSRALLSSRIPLVRPLRPPNPVPKRTPRPRLFTQNTQLLLVAHHPPRPQLPYLAQPSFKHPPHLGPSHQVARLLSTETKKYVKDQFWLATKWTAIFWTFTLCSTLVWRGYDIEVQERKHPTPDEWSYWARLALRSARARLDPSFNGLGIVDWAMAGTDFRHCLEKLENPSADGKGLVEREEGGMVMGKAGQDITGKSWAWRACYFEVVMGCALAAEHLDGMVRDKTRGIVFPPEYVIGPSNPDPRPTTPSMEAAPLEENCDRPYAPPETFYMRVLTGRGFTTTQKLDAALAYANWLEFKGLNDSALDMYQWGVDFAKAALPMPELVIADSGVLKVDGEGSTAATPNLLRAATSLAIHRARTGAVSDALPVLLSVLRARRSAPLSPFPIATPPSDTEQAEAQSTLAMLISLFIPRDYPPPPPSGDDSLLRASEKPTCEEAELMLYIGEILFAHSQSSDEGLGWTKGAVAIAEDGARTERRSPGTATTDSERKKCSECLTTGLANWEGMLKKLSRRQQGVEAREGGGDGGWLRWGGWFGREWDEPAGCAGVDLEAELRLVGERREELAREGIDAEMEKSMRLGTPGGVWIG